ncbi:hypothetical protein KVR01_003194 [Diaporthe batatas]|uniref:uncharacterized protein n=1 Tax=Diaporthe batatas TaxID=748121 RepID=UPI001D0516D8|nr:uncharacterized protein KVR01_003194 [Diaporthe batatas]KAG8167505.1 hypothetical protein KVR01_003194 [Diaporthe batatas]
MANQIVQTLNGISADSFENDGQRMEAVAAAYALVARLETPWDFWHAVGDGAKTLEELHELVPQVEPKLLRSYDATIPCFFKLPRYLEQTGYKNPVDPNDGVFQYAKDCRGKDMFHFYQENRVEGESFNQPDQPLLVDVGGNIGHDLDRFYQAHPETASRLYLEDLAEVVSLSKCPDPVNKIGYDFFTPQPIKGARAYYMHGVLHDWSDEPARKILEMQRDALTPGYSRLLIHDHIAPETVAHPHTTAYDLTMMVMVAGEERSEVHWRALLKSAGYRIVKVWSSPLAVQKVIEAELDV